MSLQQAADVEVDERAADEYIIDSDFHAGPSSDLQDLLPYIDNEVVVEKLEIRSDTPRPAGVRPKYAYNRAVGYHAHGKADDAEQVRDVMARFCLDAVIVGPGINLISAVPYPAIKTAACRGLNDYLLDRVVSPEDDIYAQLALPIWDPEACAAELDRVGDEDGIVGAYGWYTPYSRLLGEKAYDRMYDRLVALDLPLTMHVGGGTYPPVDITTQSVQTRTESVGLVNSYYAMLEVANMVTTGVFDKYPDLQVVVQEAGVLWIPFLASRMTEIYHTQPEDVRLTERMLELGQEYLEKDPGEYIYDHFRFSTQPIALPKRNKGAMLDLCDAGNTFMYSSDWPHHTLDPVNWVFDPAIDDDLRAAILHENAQDCFGV